MAGRGVVVQQEIFTAPLIAFLEAATSAPGAPHSFYDEDLVPDDASLAAGYGIVYTIAGGQYTGPPLWSPESEAILPFQITSTSKTKRGALWLADRVRLSLLSRADSGGFQVPFTPPAGWQVINRESESDGLPGVDFEGDSRNRVFSIPERFRLHVQPV